MPTTEKVACFTVAAALNYAQNLLNQENWRDAEWLLAHVLDWQRTQLITHANYKLNLTQRLTYEQLLLRLLRGEPLAYLLAKWEFWSLELLLSPVVLIPRPETELLVEIALQYIPTNVAVSIADLGTGSGAIALALAHERHLCQITATDNSRDALNIAQLNAQRLNLNNIEFLIGDWCVPLAARQFNLIVSNPPYLEIANPHLASLRFEPQLALIAGDDGLDAIRIIARDAQRCLKLGGILLLEHGYHQGEAVRRILTELNYSAINTYLDLEQRARVTMGKNVR